MRRAFLGLVALAALVSSCSGDDGFLGLGGDDCCKAHETKCGDDPDILYVCETDCSWTEYSCRNDWCECGLSSGCSADTRGKEDCVCQDGIDASVDGGELMDCSAPPR
ncbi:MAG: hypothetical protein PHU25_13250 [Deltaproteobacteria bacterium]|nr:hypothetical protein [Deltaproteobacteria bacterium]